MMSAQSNPSSQSTALVKSSAPSAEPFMPENLDQAMHLARDVSASSIVPERFRGKEYDCYVAILWGRDLGLTPMQAVFGVWIEPRSGRPGLYDQTAAALVLKSPLCKYLRPIESTPTSATWETWRHGNPEPDRMSFTIEEARTANLLGKDNWKSYPAAMLRARARMNLIRAIYPDVVGNVYTPDELEEMRDELARDRAAIEVLDQKRVPPPPPSEPPPGPPPRPAQGRIDAEADRQSRRDRQDPAPNSPADVGFAPPPASSPPPQSSKRSRAAAGPPSDPPTRDPGPAPAHSPGESLDDVFGPAPAAGAKPSAPTRVEDVPPAPATPPKLSDVDRIGAELDLATTIGAYRTERGKMNALRPDERDWLVPKLVGCLCRIVDRGPKEDLEAAFATIGEFRKVKLLHASDEKIATERYTERKAADR